MALVFTTRRTQSSEPADAPLAERLAAPRTIANVLTPAGLAAAHRIQSQAAEALQHRVGLPARTLTQVKAGMVGTSVIDPINTPADPRLVSQFGYDLCLKHRVLPWRDIGGRVTVLAASPDRFLRVSDALRAIYGPVHLALVTTEHLDRALAQVCHIRLMRQAERRTPQVASCRDWNSGKAGRWGLAGLLALVACALVWPAGTTFALTVWAMFTLVLFTGLKVAATVLHFRPLPDGPVPANPQVARLPVVTILVPLFRERDIAGALVKRLSQLRYPPDRLDVCLVLEADDGTTINALAQTDLPFWMRAIKVPIGTLQTKPRALNYALSFAKGSIIGVYDAEDAPDPDQIHKVVARFAQRGQDVACLQGRLDYYNSTYNWLARCFTIEYAAWFRIMLPGLERMGLAIPLGGTTLFFRRDILESLGGWDAHNVTEDADLGIRLARHGYRTEIIDTTTQEEANARVWPWIKQRSRWLKGYVITYCVHMRNPVALWRDLGARRFWGFQLLFAGTISQFLLAPLLWSFWLIAFGLPHPLTPLLSAPLMIGCAVTFLLAELIGIGVNMIGVNAAGKPGLRKWAPTLHVYFPLAVLAGYKGVAELVTKPFYWEKTHHGQFTGADASVTIPQPQPLRHPISAE